MSSSSRILGYDMIKTLAIFLVVFYHVGGLDYGEVVPGEYYIPNLNKVLSSFCAASVPLFFMVNGALILPRHLSLKQLLKKSFRLILLYIFGKVVLQYLLFQKLFGIPYEMAHFWFLLTLAAIYPISYLLSRCPFFKKVVLSFLLICPFLTNLICDIIAFTCPAIELPRWTHTGLFSLYSLVYFFIGSYLRKSSSPRFISVVLFLFGLFFVIFEIISMSTKLKQVYDSGNAAFPTIGSLLMSSGLFLMLKDISLPVLIKKSVIIIGKNTLGIYLFHVPLLFILRKQYCSLFEDVSYLYLMALSLGLVVSSLIFASFVNILKNNR